MAENQTLKEAWEKLPDWKKTWFKILAVIVAISIITSFISIIFVGNECNKIEKELNDNLKQLEQVNF